MDETPGYEVAYSQLVFASKSEYDPLQGNVYWTCLGFMLALFEEVVAQFKKW